jgi:hypothetical protein
MIPYQDNNYGAIGYTIISKAVVGGKIELVLIMFTMAVFGTGFVYSIARLLDKVKYLRNWIAYLGINAIGIYLAHIYFIGLSKNILISVLLSIGVSLVGYKLLQILLKKFKIIRTEKLAGVK